MNQRIKRLINEFPDSVEGESSAGPIEMAKKINEIVDSINEILTQVKRIKKLLITHE